MAEAKSTQDANAEAAATTSTDGAGAAAATTTGTDANGAAGEGDGAAAGAATAATVTEEGKPDDKAKGTPPVPVKREIFTMPVAKAQDEKRKAVEKAVADAKSEFQKELDAKIAEVRAEMGGKPTQAAVDANVDEDALFKEIAEKHGLNADATRDLMGALKKTLKLPDTSKFDQIIKEKEIEGHKIAVSKEFDAMVTPLILKDFPAATPEHIREVKARIEELAFTAGYNTYQLADIYAVKKSEFTFKNGMSAEAPKGHGTDLQPFKVLSDDDEIALANSDPKTYARYVKWLGTQQSRFIGTE